jgi:hypothetical protein
MHGSQTEAQFVGTLFSLLCSARRIDTVFIDCVGNLHAIVGKSTTMFTAHTDTVHHSGGDNTWGIADGQMVTDGKHALGADDGCGIAIMLHMIDHGIPGHYVFFRGEECGGIGSKGIVREAPELFAGITRAIAFDRAGLGDVITHQSGTRCCSDEFAQALANELNLGGMMYTPDATGVYTDTKEFTKIIAECTNLSVGYFSQHGPNEHVNLAHFIQLADRCLLVKWDDLPVTRKPNATNKRSDFGLRVVAGNEYVDWMAGIAAEDADDDGDDQVTRAYVEKTISEAMASGDYQELAHIIVMIGAEDYCASPTEGELAIIQDVADVMDNMIAAELEESLGICLEDLEYGISPEMVLSCLYEDLIDTTERPR